jgi:hypothetical protein
MRRILTPKTRASDGDDGEEEGDGVVEEVVERPSWISRMIWARRDCMCCWGSKCGSAEEGVEEDEEREGEWGSSGREGFSLGITGCGADDSLRRRREDNA